MKGCFCLLILSLPFLPIAEEGMWLLDQIRELNLQEKGLKIGIEDIYSPDNKPCIVNAVVWLGGGTAEFVSPEGLILTNHHVAFDAVQRISNKEYNYIENGFLAKSRAEEIPAPGYSALVLLEMKDITEEMLAVAKGIEDLMQIKTAIDEKTEQIREKVEQGKSDIKATIASMYNGKKYMLFIHREYQDVRVVYVPPSAIGNFGGEIDNWMWPRHTGDFSFLRVYMAEDGSGRKHHPGNVPCRPKSWLPISTGDLNEGDFTFIIGYPGMTTRYRTSYSANYNFSKNYPNSIVEFREVLDILQKVAENNPEAAIKVASMDKGLRNVMKNYQGKLDGMKKINFVQKKQAFEKQLAQFLDTDAQLKATYGDIIEKISAQYRDLDQYEAYDAALNGFRFSGILNSLAAEIYYLAQERAKPDAQRNPTLTPRYVEMKIQHLPHRFYDYCEAADRALLIRALKKAKQLPEASRISGLEQILAGDIDAFVQNAYDATKLKDMEFVKTLFAKSVQELEDIHDPLLDLTRALYPERELFRQRYDRFAANITQLRKRYIDALYAWKGTKLYPDANSTIRFTYGHVAGYRPKDAVWYNPFTTVSGVIEKDTGNMPFVVPEILKTRHAAREFGIWLDRDLADVPVAFLNRCDITGGNSGSPVLNANGELIGIAFDGNYEAMISDWEYDYDMQRAISVDIRYVMWITGKIAQADHLLQEMKVKRP